MTLVLWNRDITTTSYSTARTIPTKLKPKRNVNTANSRHSRHTTNTPFPSSSTNMNAAEFPRASPSSRRTSFEKAFTPPMRCSCRAVSAVMIISAWWVLVTVCRMFRMRNLVSSRTLIILWEIARVAWEVTCSRRESRSMSVIRDVLAVPIVPIVLLVLVEK